jgi:hypothetical protein
MMGYSLLGSVLTRPRSSTSPLLSLASRPSLCFAFALICFCARLSTSSRAFLKSFCPPCRSCSFSSMSSRARKRRRRSRSDSPNKRMGCPFTRKRRMASSLEILKVVDDDGSGDAVSLALSGRGVPLAERDAACSPCPMSSVCVCHNI